MTVPPRAISSELHFSVEPLRRKDSARCAELERELFPVDEPWSEWAFRAEIDAGNRYFGAYVDGELVGYAGLAVLGKPPSVETEVHTIGVAKSFQGKGIGAALLRALLDIADAAFAEVFLEVRTDNEPAIAMYQRFGFERIGLRRHYYRPSGADAYTMRRTAAVTSGASEQ